MSGSDQVQSKQKMALIGPVIVACLALTFFILRCQHGLNFLGFMDESEHLLGGRVINNGGRLYSTYIDSHGPFIFMLTQLYGNLFGWSTPNDARLMISGLFLLTAVLIGASPALTSCIDRLFAISLFLGPCASLWLVQSLYLVSYYPVGGVLAALGLGTFVVAAWVNGEALTWAAVPGGIAFGLLVLTAYTYDPSVAIFALSGGLAAWRQGRRQALLVFVIAGLATGLLGLVWLACFSGIVDYLTFHIVFNQVAYAPPLHALLASFCSSLLPSFTPKGIVNTLSLFVLLVSLLLFLVFVAPRQKLPVILGHFGVLLLNIRGARSFQNGTFVVAVIGVFALALPLALAHLPSGRWWMRSTATFVVAFCLLAEEAAARRAEITPFNLTYSEGLKIPPQEIDQQLEIPVVSTLQQLISPREPVLSIPYWPEFYWNLDRMPMAEFYEYLPWDAKYAKSPWWGRKRDLCITLKESPPPLIGVMNLPIKGISSIWSYIPCLSGILASTYRPLPIYPYLYLRRDRFPAPDSPLATALGMPKH